MRQEYYDQSFGVEIECYGISRERMVRVIAEYFGTSDSVEHVGRPGHDYDRWICVDPQGRRWSAVTDCSIVTTGRVDNGGAELETPILYWRDMPDLQEIIRKLRKAGAKSNPSHKCGVHVHVGTGVSAPKFTPATLRHLVNIWASHEDLITPSIGVDVRGDRYSYCAAADPRFVEELNRKKPATFDEFERCWYGRNYDSRFSHYNSSRYRMLNLHSFFNGHGTVEFRCFQFDEANPETHRKGGLHAGQLKGYVQLCLAVCDQAKQMSRSSYSPCSTENMRFSMRTWLVRLGFIGEEFETARDHLINRLPGNSAWRSGTAGEVSFHREQAVG